jgi:hypothetical protein
MVGVNPLEPPPLNLLEQAFRGLVDSLVEHRQRHDALADGACSFRIMSCAEFANTSSSVLRALDIVDDPEATRLSAESNPLGR